MADRAKHAFGALERVDESIANGVLDAYDVLFVKDENGKPYVGWIDKDGNKVIVDNETDLSGIEAELETKANAEEVEALEGQIAAKVDAETVQAMIKEYSESVIEVVEF